MHDVSHILNHKKYIKDDSHVINHEPIQLQMDLLHKETLIQILDMKIRELSNKKIPMVKVLWSIYGVDNDTRVLRSNMDK